MKTKQLLYLAFSASMLFLTMSQEAACYLKFWSKPPIPVSKFAKLTSGLRAVNLKKTSVIGLGIAAIASLAYLIFRDKNKSGRKKAEKFEQYLLKVSKKVAKKNVKENE